MKNPDEKYSQGDSFSSAVQAVLSGFKKLVQSELRLMRLELQLAAKVAGRDTAWMVLFGILALLGILPFLAFLVIGLGKLLDENYWLSSLIISLVFMGIGTILGRHFAKKLTQVDVKSMNLPHTRQSVSTEAQWLRTKLQEAPETTERRVS